jgi:RNA polymerase sigma factor (sigma-70 family)
LISVAYDRLTALTRKNFRDYERVRPGGVETLDVFHNSLIRLQRALEQVVPSSAREFYGLAALQIRRELLDLCRQLSGRGDEPRPKMEPLPEGSWHGGEGAAKSFDPQHLAVWAEFHEAVHLLEPSEREVVDLLWYQDLSQEEAAEVLGVDKSTVKRRWRRARLKLAAVLGGALPEA